MVTFWNETTDHLQWLLNARHGEDTYWVSCDRSYGVVAYTVHNSEGDCVYEAETADEVEYTFTSGSLA